MSRRLRRSAPKLHDLDVKVKAVRCAVAEGLPHVTLLARVAVERVDDDRVDRLRTPHLDGAALRHLPTESVLVRLSARRGRPSSVGALLAGLGVPAPLARPAPLEARGASERSKKTRAGGKGGAAVQRKDRRLAVKRSLRRCAV